MILYTPNPEKSWLLTKATSFFMTIRDTRNETTVPTRRSIHSSPVRAKPLFKSLSREAPAITGIAMKNENFAATVLSKP